MSGRWAGLSQLPGKHQRITGQRAGMRGPLTNAGIGGAPGDPQGTSSLLQRAERQWWDPPEASRLKSRAGTASSPHPRSPKTEGHWGADERDSEPIPKSPPSHPIFPSIPSELRHCCAPLNSLHQPHSSFLCPRVPSSGFCPGCPPPPVAAPNDPQALLWQRPHPREAFRV